MKGRTIQETYGVSPPINPSEIGYVRASSIKKAAIIGILLGGIVMGSIIYFIKDEEISAERKLYIENIENLANSFELISGHATSDIERETLKKVVNSIRNYSEKTKEKYGVK